jgi:hypothetical protein
MTASILERILIHGDGIFYRVDINLRMIKKRRLSGNLKGNVRKKIDDTLFKVT